MVFENEINIYDPDAIANEFHTQATQISVAQGKISAMISDSQIQELQNGTVNMYDRLVLAEMDINGITTQVSSLTQKDGELESQISTIRQTASSISAEVTSVKNNYALKAQIILAINTVTQESETVISADKISLKGKTINLSSDTITIKSDNFNVDSNGNMVASNGTFSGKITSTSGKIGGFTIGSSSLYNGMTSYSDTSNNGVYVGTNGIALGKGAFKVSSSGTLTATNATISGTITSTSGKIGGFTIGSNNIHNGMTSLNDTSNNGVWLGTNGIALGAGNFKVTSAGVLTAKSGTFSGSLSAATGTFKGELSAATGTFKGQVNVGSNPYMLLDTDGRLKGGKGSTQYGYIDYSRNVYDMSVGVTRYGVQIQGGAIALTAPLICTLNSTNVSATHWNGATETIRVITSITVNADGSISYSWRDMKFVNGLLIASS